MRLGPRRQAATKRTPGSTPSRLAAAALLCTGTGLLGAGFWLPAKAELAQYLLNRAWAATQDDRRNVRPWPWADTWPVARLTLPASDEPLTVLAGASGRNLAFGPALMDGSALPGTPGVSVIAGHRDTTFRALADLKLGDRFRIEQPDGSKYDYDVTAIDVIDSQREKVRMDSDQSVVLLVTCYPFDAVMPGGPLRYVVTGRLATGAL
jgi:sortase A